MSTEPGKAKVRWVGELEPADAREGDTWDDGEVVWRYVGGYWLSCAQPTMIRGLRDV